MDDIPTENSYNEVSSGGVWAAIRALSISIIAQIGDLSLLHTTAKDTVVNAINETFDLISTKIIERYNRLTGAPITLPSQALTSLILAGDTTSFQVMVDGAPQVGIYNQAADNTAYGGWLQSPSTVRVTDGTYTVFQWNKATGTYVELQNLAAAITDRLLPTPSGPPNTFLTSTGPGTPPIWTLPSTISGFVSYLSAQTLTAAEQLVATTNINVGVTERSFKNDYLGI